MVEMSTPSTSTRPCSGWYSRCQLGQRALARARTADDAHGLARLHPQRHARLRAGPVTELDPVELDAALHGSGGLGVCTSVRVFRMSPSRCIEMPTCWKSVHSCASRITGPATLPDSMLKAISCPTVSCPSITSRAPSHGGHRHQLADEGHAAVGHGADRGRAKGCLDVGRQLVVPLADPLRLDRAGLDRLHAADRFHQEGLVFRATVELLVQPRPQRGREGQRQHHVARQRRHHDQRQPDAVVGHHGQEHDGEEQVQHHRDGIARQERPDVLQFPHPRHGITHLARAK